MQIPENHLLVIFGASGDLTRRKLIPALFNLYKQDLLPERFSVLGVSRSKLDDKEFRNLMSEAIDFAPKQVPSDDLKTLNSFLLKLNYISIHSFDYESFGILKKQIIEICEKNQIKNNIVFYMATPPDLYDIIPSLLGDLGLNHPDYKLIIEKPFGTNLDSSKRLNKHLLHNFNENQLYRIDHFLGKETVQNILLTRFSNTIFEPIWNRNFIHHIEITSSESIGIEKRGGYYENSGALRDMVQNHLLQLVGLVAMEPPVFANSDSIRNETLKVFQSLRPLSQENICRDVIRGQYTAATIDNIAIPAYRDEGNVNKNSKTETFVALKFYIDNWRWEGIPFYIRTGKRMPTRVSEIVIHFKPIPHILFVNQEGSSRRSNKLVIRIQPDEGLMLTFGMKVPGAGFTVQDVSMDFHYTSLSDVHLPEAYERLLLDCFLNDSTLYARGDVVEATWKFIDPILETWKEKSDIPIYGYPAGTWGPSVADNLIEEPWLTWRNPCKNLSDDGIFGEL